MSYLRSQLIRETFKTSRGVNLSFISSLAEKSVGSIFIVHGYAEHIGRYEHVIQYFNQKGFHVYGCDLHGHGNSEGKPAYIKRFEHLTKDLDDLIQFTEAKNKDLPFYLIGHSMGASLCVAWAMTQPTNKVQGLVLSAPSAMVSPEISPFLQKISPFVSKLIPTVPVADSQAKDVLSKDPKVYEAFSKDPHCYNGKVRASTGNELLRLANFIQQHASELKCPYILLHGTADRLTAPEGSKRLHEKSCSNDKEYVELPGLYHELFQEPEKMDVLDICYKKIATWMKKDS